MKAREISAKLAERAEEVCLHLFPQGHRKGHEFAIGSLSGDRGDSLKVRLDGEKSGLWSDFATGEKGDMIDLWRLSQGKTFIEAMKDIRAFLGLPDEEKRFHSSSKNFSRPSGPSGNAIYGRALDYLTKRGLTPETLKENGNPLDGHGHHLSLPSSGWNPRPRKGPKDRAEERQEGDMGQPGGGAHPLRLADAVSRRPGRGHL